TCTWTGRCWLVTVGRRWDKDSTRRSAKSWRTSSTSTWRRYTSRKRQPTELPTRPLQQHPCRR
ncbi:unnamed protein product, partial [Ectocarpus sp. 8 AP-2014]